MNGGSRSSVTIRPLSDADGGAERRGPAATPSAIEPVDFITVAARQARQPDVGADREIEAGGEDHQRQARRDEERQARLPQHVQQVRRREERRRS